MKSLQEDICSKRRSWRRSREQRMDQSPAPSMCYLDSSSFAAIFKFLLLCWWNWMEWEEMDGCWDRNVMSWEQKCGVEFIHTVQVGTFTQFTPFRQDLQWRLSFCEVESIIEPSSNLVIYVKEVCRKFLTFKWHPCFFFFWLSWFGKLSVLNDFVKDAAWSCKPWQSFGCLWVIGVVESLLIDWGLDLALAHRSLHCWWAMAAQMFASIWKAGDKTEGWEGWDCWGSKCAWLDCKGPYQIKKPWSVEKRTSFRMQ